MIAKFSNKRGEERAMKKIKKLFLVAMLCLITLIVQTMTVAQATDEEATRDLIPEEEMQSYSVDLRSLASNQEAQDTLPFPITLRDFKADYVIFESDGDNGVVERMVTLNPETKKPEFTVSGIKHLAWRALQNNNDKNHSFRPKYYKDNGEEDYDRNYDEAVEWYENLDPNLDYEDVLKAIEGDLYKYVIYHANHLFEDVEGLNQKEQTFLTLTKNPKNKNMYEYIDSEFFPLDDQLWGNEKRDHNYHFTLESHTQFYFDGKELVFNFTGDDDVWAFIDNMQVIDLGGTHLQASQKVVIESDGYIWISRPNSDEGYYLTDSEGNSVRLKTGWHDFDFFFMERHTDYSNLKITTNMEFNPGIELTKIAYLKDEKGEETILYPIDPETNPKPVVYPGQTIYYKFYIKNTGNINLENIILQDDKLGLEVNLRGVSINGNSMADSDYQITVDGKSVEYNPFEKLLSIDNAPNNIIEISSDLFQYVVTDEDVVSGQVVNEAIVAGTPSVAGSEGFDKNSLPRKFSTAEAIVDVALPTPSLTLKKQVVDSDGGVIDPLNKDDLFTIQVQAQDSGGEVFNVRLKAEDTVTLPVEYGVTYTIKEIVPMNYKLQSITINDIEQDEVTIKIEDSNYNVVITNEVTNTKWFQFKQRVENFVAQVKSIVQPGEES